MAMRWLVTYDVSSDKSRARLAKELEKYGVRVQQSVFDVEFKRRLAETLKKFAEEEVLAQGDSVIFQPVGRTARRARLVAGKPNGLSDQQWWVI